MPSTTPLRSSSGITGSVAAPRTLLFFGAIFFFHHDAGLPESWCRRSGRRSGAPLVRVRAGRATSPVLLHRVGGAPRTWPKETEDPRSVTPYAMIRANYVSVAASLFVIIGFRPHPRSRTAWPIFLGQPQEPPHLHLPEPLRCHRRWNPAGAGGLPGHLLVRARQHGGGHPAHIRAVTRQGAPRVKSATWPRQPATKNPHRIDPARARRWASVSACCRGNRRQRRINRQRRLLLHLRRSPSAGRSTPTGSPEDTSSPRGRLLTGPLVRTAAPSPVVAFTYAAAIIVVIALTPHEGHTAALLHLLGPRPSGCCGTCCIYARESRINPCGVPTARRCLEAGEVGRGLPAEPLMCLVQVASFAITIVGALWWALGVRGRLRRGEAGPNFAANHLS